MICTSYFQISNCLIDFGVAILSYTRYCSDTWLAPIFLLDVGLELLIPKNTQTSDIASKQCESICSYRIIQKKTAYGQGQYQTMPYFVDDHTILVTVLIRELHRTRALTRTSRQARISVLPLTLWHRLQQNKMPFGNLTQPWKTTIFLIGKVSVNVHIWEYNGDMSPLVSIHSYPLLFHGI